MLALQAFEGSSRNVGKAKDVRWIFGALLTTKCFIYDILQPFEFDAMAAKLLGSNIRSKPEVQARVGSVPRFKESDILALELDSIGGGIGNSLV